MDKMQACKQWVSGFNNIPTNVVWKLAYEGDVLELTKLRIGDRVRIPDRGNFEEGEITKVNGNGTYDVSLDKFETSLTFMKDQIKVARNDVLPRWGTMWAFDNSSDNDWLGGNEHINVPDHLQEVSDCGFRIYKQDDFGYLIGVESAASDFYERYWLPLYEARELNWHDEASEERAPELGLEDPSRDEATVEVLVSLAKDNDWHVRRRVGQNPSTPVKVLAELARDEHRDVRLAVAKNPHTPTAMLVAFSKDEHWRVRKAVAKNPLNLAGVLEGLANDERFEVRKEVASNPSPPVAVLAELAKDDEYQVRFCVAKNPFTPESALDALGEDERQVVREAAADSLAINKGKGVGGSLTARAAKVQESALDKLGTEANLATDSLNSRGHDSTKTLQER